MITTRETEHQSRASGGIQGGCGIDHNEIDSGNDSKFTIVSDGTKIHKHFWTVSREIIFKIKYPEEAENEIKWLEAAMR